ncbi:C1QT8 protein, partial [Oenanthe oenanthe]|nr:C1QT8 protein [Oenanthe oenanthe]
RMSSVLLLALLLLLPVGNAGSQPERALPRRRLSCVRCCGPEEQPVPIVSQRWARMSGEPRYSLPKIQPTIDITILKGGCCSFPAFPLLLFLRAFPTAKFSPKFRAKCKGQPKVSKMRIWVPHARVRSPLDPCGPSWCLTPFPSPAGEKGERGELGRPGAAGPFSLNVHTWNFKETYLHLMRNEQPVAILYTQPSDRSVMQSQSLMLDLQEGDEVWVRMFKRERENAVYSEESDVYIIFNGHLIKPALE